MRLHGAVGGECKAQDGFFTARRIRLLARGETMNLGAEFGHESPLVRGIAVSDEPGGEFDPAALRHAFGLLEGWVAQGVVPGVGALVLHRGRVIGEAYLGTMRRGTEQPVDSETI